MGFATEQIGEAVVPAAAVASRVAKLQRVANAGRWAQAAAHAATQAPVAGVVATAQQGDVKAATMPASAGQPSHLAWVSEMYDLLKLDFDWAIPGHGRLLTKDEIRQYVKNVETMNARMKELVRTGVP